MRIALGWKAHSGWAALVALGERGSEAEVIERRRVELIEDSDASWAKQPYHAARSLHPREAGALVDRGHETARRSAVREMRGAVERARRAGHDVAACAVLVADPLPDWSVEEILAVHPRMHMAEGALFRDALTAAAEACGLRLVRIPEKRLDDEAERVLKAPVSDLRTAIASLGKSLGPPWGRDQKDASLAALIALQGSTT